MSFVSLTRRAASLCLLVLLAAILTPVPARCEVVDRVIAVVNDEVILLSELQDQTAAFESSWSGIADAGAREAKRREAEGRVLDDMINERLLGQQIKELKLRTSEQEIDETIQEIMGRNKIEDLDTFKQLVARQGIEWRAYREEISTQLKRNQFIQAKVGMRIKISDDEVKDAYEKETSMAQREYEYRARHILFRASKADSPETLATQRAKAETARERALAGEDFATLAQTLSESPDARFGGDLGFFQKGVMVREFETAVMALEIGGLSQVVRSPFGYHVIKLEEKRLLPGKEFEEVKESIRARLREEAANKEMKTWLTQLRQKAFVALKLDAPPKKASAPTLAAPKQEAAPTAAPTKEVAP